uniref:Amino acid transporter transmembrane domain-containing protein n=1 Tax=Aegilops tauschii TaxID=37682 RepID=R7W6J3_AEGTA
MADKVVATYYYPPMEVAAAELGHTAGSKLDDDGRNKRTGTMWTASSHIITAVIGSGVLSLGWAIAQLGWVAGPAAMLSTGKRNYTYMDAVNANLSGIKVQICGVLQYANIVGVAIGYTIAASTSMLAIKRANCFHGNGHADPCKLSSVPYMIIFGVAQVFFSQIPDFDQISWLSMLAAAMSFTYSSIGLGLGIVQVIANGGVKGSLTGISIGTVTPMQKVWRSTQAFGDIAFAYSYSLILIEIQDTIRAPPPSESTVMKRATMVYCQPLFAFVEKWAAKRWPESTFVTGEVEVPLFRTYKVNMFRATWRTAFVVATTVVSMMLPFFNDVVGFLGALGFWPLTVYFPVEMYVVQKKVPKWSTQWVCLQMLSLGCLAISLAAAAGSIAGIKSDLKVYHPFKS